MISPDAFELFAAWYSDPATYRMLGGVVAWILIIGLLITGFAGTILPLLPGPTLIWFGAIIHYFAKGMEASKLTWQSLTLISVLWVVTVILDWFSSAIGAKWFGSTKWGVIGAIIGGIVGLFFGLPGLIIGPIAGVFLFEMIFAGQHIRQASSSTVGTLVGTIAGTLARVVVAAGMIAVYVADVWFLNDKPGPV